MSEEDELTLWQRFKGTMSGVGAYIKESRIVEGISSVVDTVTHSKAYKGLQYVLAGGVPIGSIVFYSLMIAGIANPAGLAIAAVVGAIGVASIVVGAIMDTFKARSARLLKNEHNLLADCRETTNNQNALLSKHPKLQQVLFPESTKAQENKNTEVVKSSGWWPTVKTIIKTVARYALDIVRTALEVPITFGFNLIKSVGAVLFFMATDAKNIHTLDAIKDGMQGAIDLEKNKHDTPKYSNLQELRLTLLKERIEYKALEMLAHNPEYNTMSADEIRSSFAKAKKDIAAKARTLEFDGAIKSFGKDFLRMLDPYSEYNNLNALQESVKKIPESQVIRSIDPTLVIPSKVKQEAIAAAAGINSEVADTRNGISVARKKQSVHAVER